jgi:hypothetical protein
MRSADEQLRLVREKAEKLRRRRQALLREGTGAAGLVLAAFLCFLLPRAGGTALPEGAVYGSLILTSPLVSYAVVAVLAFVLGICVTLLCLHRRGPEDEDP